MGSLACEKLSKNRVEIGIVPIGSIGLSIFVFDLYLSSSVNNTNQISTVMEFISQPQNWRIIFDLIMIGACGGIFSVPFYAKIQKDANPQYLSRIIAANNIFNAIFMVSASLIAIITLSSGLNILEFFALLSALNILLMIYMHSQSKEFIQRFLKLIKNKS